MILFVCPKVFLPLKLYHQGPIPTFGALYSLTLLFQPIHLLPQLVAARSLGISSYWRRRLIHSTCDKEILRKREVWLYLS